MATFLTELNRARVLAGMEPINEARTSRLSEEEDAPKLSALVKNALEAGDSEILEVYAEGDDSIVVAVRYDFPECAPTAKEVKLAVALEFKKVTREKSDMATRTNYVMVYRFTKV